MTIDARVLMDIVSRVENLEAKRERIGRTAAKNLVETFEEIAISILKNWEAVRPKGNTLGNRGEMEDALGALRREKERLTDFSADLDLDADWYVRLLELAYAVHVVSANSMGVLSAYRQPRYLVALAQARNSAKAAERSKLRRRAIFASCEGVDLVGTSAFAESIRDTVLDFVESQMSETEKVILKPRGLSTRTIQREICAILGERSRR
jgi:hypothetical protein